jgi:hypothetical protein
MEHRKDKLDLLTQNISQTSYRINDYYELLDKIEDENDREKVIDCITGEKMALRTLQEILDKCKPDKKGDKKEKKEKEEEEKKDYDPKEDEDVEIVFLDALEGKKKGKK